VFIHDAIDYMVSEDDVRAALQTAYAHCRPGGAALFCPDHVKETFRSTTGHGGEDGSERSLRYLQWEWDPDPSDATYTLDLVYLMRDAAGCVQVEYDRHVCGLFGREQWLAWLREAGFEPEVASVDLAEIEPGAYRVFICRRPA
jgi:hypothetical protein